MKRSTIELELPVIIHKQYKWDGQDLNLQWTKSTGLQPAALPIMRTFSFNLSLYNEIALTWTWTKAPESSVLCSTSWAIEAIKYGEIGNRTLTSVMQTRNTNHYMISPARFLLNGVIL